MHNDVSPLKDVLHNKTQEFKKFMERFCHSPWNQRSLQVISTAIH